MFKKVTLFTAGMLASSLLSWANPKPHMHGLLTNQHSEVVANASIYIVETGFSATADASGKFELPSLHPGNYTLYIAVPGYSRVVQKIEVEEGQKRLNLAVNMDANKIKEVEVFGIRDGQPKKMDAITRLPLKPSDQIQSISVISDRVIEAQGDLTISDVTRNVPGVYTFATYGNQRESMSMRGFRGVPVLKNGVRVNSDFRGIGVLSDMEGVESIQVLKGAAAITQGIATDLGSPGGIINIVTKTPDFVNNGKASLRLGSWNQLRPTFDVQSVLNKSQSVAFRIDGAYEHANSYRPGVSLEKIYVNPSLAWRPDEKTSVVLEMDFMNDSRTPDPGTINLAENDSNAIYQIPYDLFPGFSSNKAITRNTTYAMRIQRDISKNIYIRAAYFGSLLDQEAITTSFSSGSSKPNNLPLLPYEQRYRKIGSSGRLDKNSVLQLDIVGKDLKTGFMKHTFMAGVDYHSTALTTSSAKMGNLNYVDIIDFTGNFGYSLPDNGFLFVPEKKDENNNVIEPATTNGAAIDLVASDPVSSQQNAFGFSVQDVLSVTDWAKVFLGARFSSQISKGSAGETGYSTGSAWDPQFGLMVSPIKGLNLFASYTTSTSLRGAGNLDSNGNELGNQRINQLEAGLKSDWFDNRLRFNLTFFKINNRNMSLTVYDANWNPTGFYMKGGNDERMGMEVEVLGRLRSNLEVILGYAYINAQYKEHNAYYPGSSPLNTPKHTANAWIRYHVSNGNLRGLSIGAGAYYIGERPVNDWAQVVTHEGMVAGQKPFNIEAVTTVNLQVGYQYKNYGIRLLCNNLMNQIGYNAYRTSYINQTDPRNFAAVISYQF